MKYAVPISGGKLSAHFGHCGKFAFFETDESTKTITGREVVEAPEHQPGLLPVWLAEKGAGVVIAGLMGERAHSLLEQRGITVVTGVQESDPEQAVLQHLNGSLSTAPMACDHGHGKCTH
jgi:predicted Fe-Mo cluster-binding NifX family protein